MCRLSLRCARDGRRVLESRLDYRDLRRALGGVDDHGAERAGEVEEPLLENVYEIT